MIVGGFDGLKFGSFWPGDFQSGGFVVWGINESGVWMGAPTDGFQDCTNFSNFVFVASPTLR